MKAVIYARQSSGKDDLSESVEAQILNCKHLAEKEHIDVIGVFRDLNTSGETYPTGAEEVAAVDTAYKNWGRNQSAKKTFRPGLGNAIRHFSEIDMLIVNEMTRLYRPINGSFLEGYINQLLKTNSIQVLQVQGGNIDLSQFDQQLITMIKNQILYEDLQKKRTNSIIAFQNKRDSGKLCNGCRIYGIRYLGNDQIEVIPECIPVIRYIFDSICAHKTYISIIQTCNERWGGSGDHGKIFFYDSSIYSIARQPLYAGYQYNTNKELIRNTQITGQEIISFSQWQQVQTIISGKRQNYRTREKKNWLPLSGRLFCGSCGSRLISYMDHGYLYYICKKKDLSPAAHESCRNSRIRFETMCYGKPELYEAIYPLLALALVDRRQKLINLSRTQNDQEQAQTELARMLEIEKQAFSFVSEGLADMEHMRKILQTHQAKRNALALQLAEARSCQINVEAETEALNLLLEQIVKRTLTHDKYSELVDQIDFQATIFRDKVQIHTCILDFTLPRIRLNTHSWMPESHIETGPNGQPPDLNEMSALHIFYETGKKEVLAEQKNAKIMGF